jgi:hypothetical protein
MALMKTITYNGQTIENAYIRIDFIAGSKYNGWESTVGVYSSKNLSQPIFSEKVRAYQTINSVTEMYEYLKSSHPTFIDASNI